METDNEKNLLGSHPKTCFYTVIMEFAKVAIATGVQPGVEYCSYSREMPKLLCVLRMRVHDQTGTGTGARARTH
jgi:hypothetical protein